MKWLISILVGPVLLALVVWVVYSDSRARALSVSQRALEARARLLAPPLVVVDGAEVAVRVGVRRVERERAPVGVRRLARPSLPGEVVAEVRPDRRRGGRLHAT